MVKRTSCLASNEMFQVRVLVGLLQNEKQKEGQPDWRRDPVGSRLAMSLAGSTPAPSAEHYYMVFVV